MSELKKIQAGTAAEICGKYEQAAEILPLLSEGMSPVAFLDKLVEEDRLQEASRFLAHALPKREAVWWACLCAREALPDGGDETAEGLLKLAESWVRKPTDENRRSAMAAAEAAGFDSPASWAAVAAFWSGDSLAPADSPAVAPSDELTGTAVAATTMLAAFAGDPATSPDRFREFLKNGMDVAKGGSGRGEDPMA
jgi:hypothetical protein